MESIKDELAGLRALLKGLESGGMKILLNGHDVSKEQIATLKPEITYLESVLARRRNA